ncbi:hypothetical protein EYF80_015889 [Liparis tanakae]|uniref:Uncharacterized protein n=1 Tax=Liparis tanakae TaxID=230148 RepID=A0A4Z2I908_9TELE|nr:hypothetical protein EYF80_015889 [Liparis tanakae]
MTRKSSGGRIKEKMGRVRGGAKLGMWNQTRGGPNPAEFPLNMLLTNSCRQASSHLNRLSCVIHPLPLCTAHCPLIHPCRVVLHIMSRVSAPFTSSRRHRIVAKANACVLAWRPVAMPGVKLRCGAHQRERSGAPRRHFISS